jgi:hypothetical protein
VRGGPRPAAIRWFAALFLLAALLAYGDGLRDLVRTADYLAAYIPGVAFDRDRVIVILSARLSIALIPVALVWFFASNMARWLATIMAAGKLLNLPAALVLIMQGEAVAPLWLASLLFGLAAVASLFTTDARRWFTKVPTDVAA